MTQTFPLLGDAWPYTEAAVAPELAQLPVDVFFSDPKGSSISAAQWVTPVDPAAAPRASYALRIRRFGHQGEIARWDPLRGVWQVTKRFPVPDAGEACAIVELKGILLSNVQTPEALGTRMKALLAAEPKPDPAPPAESRAETDQFGNLVVHHGTGYKQIIVGGAMVLRRAGVSPEDLFKPAPDTVRSGGKSPSVIYFDGSERSSNNGVVIVRPPVN